MTSNKFVNQNTQTTYHRMGHETFSIFCDGPWDFVEEFRMGHQNFGGISFSPPAHLGNYFMTGH